MTTPTSAPASDDWAAAMRLAARLDAPSDDRHLSWQIVDGGDSLTGRRLLVVELTSQTDAQIAEAIRVLAPRGRTVPGSGLEPETA